MKKTFFGLVLGAALIFGFNGCEKENGTPCDANSPNRIGAVCNDGTTSNSVGSGTCSGHGGVDYWLCK